MSFYFGLDLDHNELIKLIYNINFVELSSQRNHKKLKYLLSITFIFDIYLENYILTGWA